MGGLAFYIQSHLNKFEKSTVNPADPNFSVKTPRVLEICKILRNQYCKPKKDHFLYWVAVVEDEAKDIGLYGYMEKHRNDNTKMIRVYVGVSKDGVPTDYHTDAKKCCLSSIAKACQPGSGYCAIYYQSMRVCKGIDHAENMRLAHSFEAQYQFAMQVAGTVKKDDNKLVFQALNKNLETEQVRMLTDKEMETSAFIGTSGTPPIVLDIEATANEKHSFEHFCDGMAFCKVLKAHHKIQVLDVPTTLFPFSD